MKCPFCAHVKDKVVDSRETGSGDAIRRRRECLACGRRFTSYERVEEMPYFVVKKDGRRERLDREKAGAGPRKAGEKRPVSRKSRGGGVARGEAMVHEGPDRGVPADQIGEFLMERLRELDKVAFVRFASVYRNFREARDFENFVGSLSEAES